MGGETIIGILENARLDASHNIILQPMTQIKQLRRYLFENGYETVKEGLAEEGDKIYHVLQVKKTGRRIDYNDLELYVGTKYEKINDSTRQKYMEKEIKRLEKVLNEMKRSKNVSDEQRQEAEKELFAFKQAKGEKLI